MVSNIFVASGLRGEDTVGEARAAIAAVVEPNVHAPDPVRVGE